MAGRRTEKKNLKKSLAKVKVPFKYAKKEMKKFNPHDKRKNWL